MARGSRRRGARGERAHRAQLERACGAASALRLPTARLDELAHARPRGWPEAAHEVHGRGDLPSEIAFLERALALLAPGDGARAELLPAMGARCSRPAAWTAPQRVADEAGGRGR